MLVTILKHFPFRELVVIYVMDKGYVTCLADVLIVVGILACYGSFAAAHELFEAKKNEVLASGALSINVSMTKVKAYISLVLAFNVAVMVLVGWVFWPVDGFLLYLLSYKVGSDWLI